MLKFQPPQEFYAVCCHVLQYERKHLQFQWDYNAQSCSYSTKRFPMFGCSYQPGIQIYSISFTPLYDSDLNYVFYLEDVFQAFQAREDVLLFLENAISFFPINHFYEIREICKTKSDMGYLVFIKHGIRLKDLNEHTGKL